MNKWTKEFPTEEGTYWFYGYRWGRISMGEKEKPVLAFVRVHRTGKGGKGPMLYIADGHFLYKSEVEDAHFLKADLPDLPIIE